MAINIDQQRLEEYEGAKYWNAATDLTPKWEGAKDWTAPEYTEGEEPPLQWLLDAGLPFILGGGAGAAYVGRKTLTKKAMKALDKIKGKTPKGKSVIPPGVPLYDKAGRVIGVDNRIIPGGYKPKTVSVGYTQPRFFNETPYMNPLYGSGMRSLELPKTFGPSIEYLKGLPVAAREAYKRHQTAKQAELLKKIDEMFNQKLGPRVKGSQKVHSPTYKGPHPEYRDIGPISMNSPFYGAHNVNVAEKLAGGSVKEHMKQSILKSNPELTKKSITNKIIDTLLGLD